MDFMSGAEAGVRPQFRMTFQIRFAVHRRNEPRSERAARALMKWVDRWMKRHPGFGPVGDPVLSWGETGDDFIRNRMTMRLVLWLR